MTTQSEWLRKEAQRHDQSASDKAFTSRRRATFKHRAKKLRKAADEIERLATECAQKSAPMRVLDDLVDRACKNGVISSPMPHHLSELVDWLRALYPEIYTTTSRQKVGL